MKPRSIPVSLAKSEFLKICKYCIAPTQKYLVGEDTSQVKQCDNCGKYKICYTDVRENFLPMDEHLRHPTNRSGFYWARHRDTGEMTIAKFKRRLAMPTSIFGGVALEGWLDIWEVGEKINRPGNPHDGKFNLPKPIDEKDNPDGFGAF